MANVQQNYERRRPCCGVRDVSRRLRERRDDRLRRRAQRRPCLSGDLTRLDGALDGVNERVELVYCLSIQALLDREDRVVQLVREAADLPTAKAQGGAGELRD